MRLTDIETPALILDRTVMDRNLRTMTGHVARRGVDLRPHLKTAKSIDVARLALVGNFGGITVSTLTEAEYFAAHGLRDILYAVAMVPGKMDRVAALQRHGVRLQIITDNLAAARALAESAAARGIRVPVLIEIDVGEGRSGVLPEAPDLIEIGRALDAAEGTELAGVMAHAGHSYACRTIAEVAKVAEQERRNTVLAASRLREAGLPCATVSVGSTPTALHAPSVEGITEIRCGVYMFGDLFQAEIGSCRTGDIAMTVLASVIGHRPDRNALLIDAGALALSKDRSTEATAHDAGFGLIAPAAGGEPIPGARVARVNQEHGIVEGASPLPYDDLPIGSQVRVLPNHACLTAAMYDRYYVVAGGDEVVAHWPRANGWERRSLQPAATGGI